MKEANLIWNEYHAQKINEQKIIEKKLQTRNTSTQEKLQNRTNERRWPTVTKEQFKEYANWLKINRGLRSCAAHEAAAHYLGYKSYNSYLAATR